MNTLEQIIISGFDMTERLNQDRSNLAVLVDDNEYEVCEVRKSSRIPKSDARFGFLIPIGSASQKLQNALKNAYDEKKRVVVMIGDDHVSGKVGSLPTQGIRAGCGLNPPDAADTFSFSIETDCSSDHEERA